MGRTTRRPPLPILTSLRFFAAAEVVAYHFVTTRASDAAVPDGFLKGLASGGFAAVTFFFILSGFILTYVHAGQTERDGCSVKAAAFWRLRIARLAPAYYLGLLIALPIVVFYMQHATTPGWLRIVGLVLVLSFLQAWWPSLATLWNLPAWSLSVEVFFYALFPWMASAAARLSRTSLFLVAYCLIVAATAFRAEFLSTPDAIREGRPDLEFQAYFPLLYLPQFVFGMALGRQHLFGSTISPRLLSAMFGISVSVLVLLFGFGWLLPWWTRSDPILVLLFALIILGGARPAAATLLTLPAFVLLGEASYSIYILHIPLRLWWDVLYEALGLNLPAWLFFPLYFGWVTAASIVSLRYVETPLRRLIGGWRISSNLRRSLSALAR
jgi:peptidoglycan/LPS O-acetylase OafA/YrhL